MAKIAMPALGRVARLGKSRKLVSLWKLIFGGGDAMNSTSALKSPRPDARSLIEKIKGDIKKRAEAKARRMLLKTPKRLAAKR
jgi:hypothetical protein